MSIILHEEQTQQIFLTLAESLDGGEAPPTTDLVTYLQHPEASIRRLAIEVIELENDSAAIPALLRAASDTNVEVSLLAGEVLRGFQNPAAIGHLVAGLESSASETRLAALVALRERREPQALDALIRRISDAEPEIRRQAVTAVANYRSHEQLFALRSALHDESAAVRRVAIEAVAQFNDDPLVFNDLIAALGDSNWEVRRQAALELGRFPSWDATAALKATLEDPAWQVVREAALSLARLQVDAGEGVAKLLTHELSDLRIAGAVALGASQNPSWIDRLEPLLNDQDGGVRKSARLAIEQLATLRK